MALRVRPKAKKDHKQEWRKVLCEIVEGEEMQALFYADAEKAKKQREPCTFTAVVSEYVANVVEGRTRKDTKPFAHYTPKDVGMQLTLHGIDTLIGKGNALTLLRLCYLEKHETDTPSDDIMRSLFGGSARTAALRCLTLEYARRQYRGLEKPLCAKCAGKAKPNRCAPGMCRYMPPLVIPEPIPDQRGKQKTALVANKPGMVALLAVLFGHHFHADDTVKGHQTSVFEIRSQRSKEMWRSVKNGEYSLVLNSQKR